ncbi:hypothetical protein CEXT_224601 [Caerostris extrusa]|uniref:Uncharacterized protein n=1 Tax=Caerostris extrusa TaxID=172846 RepID=A0AAV4XW04_CAEEX|nr:hypothetical protein CEXT_224601 [Caerostris extrusa]
MRFTIIAADYWIGGFEVTCSSIIQPMTRHYSYLCCRIPLLREKLTRSIAIQTQRCNGGKKEVPTEVKAAKTSGKRERSPDLMRCNRKTTTKCGQIRKTSKIILRRKKNIKKNNEDVGPVEPPVVIKEEPVEFVPEPFPSEDKGIQNIQKKNEDVVPVEPAVVIKEEPVQEFDPQPSASADVVIKDEFVVSGEDYHGSSALVPPSTESTSHVTLSVACLGLVKNPTTDNKSNCRKFLSLMNISGFYNVINDNEDVTPVGPSIVIKEEPVEFDSDPSTSADNVIQENGDAVPVQPAVFIKQEPIEFDPEPYASTDIVIKDEFVVCSKEYTGSSADVPPSTEPTSHVTLSVACLGSSQNRDSDQ